ncbi:MAG: CBS domain-containing protein [Rhodospirillales bacterium]|nr:CBS domain-containing protein [Rhodospirillales bacterium]
MERKIIPEIVKRQAISSLKAENTAFEAATMMTSADIGAVVITGKDDKVIGIVTERDITRRVISKGLDPQTTPVSEIMTKNPESLAPDDSARDALELMQARNFRHLPVVEDGICVAMVSVRDLYKAVLSTLEESIRETEAFVFGDRYGA